MTDRDRTTPATSPALSAGATAPTGPSELPRAVMIAWGVDKAPSRGPSRGLSHDRIVSAAMEIADRDGLPAVTMQAVAKSLGFTAMSLYRYVSNKDELMTLMQDAAMRGLAELQSEGDWEDRLRIWAEGIREDYRRHPWALDIPHGQASVLMPNSVRVADLGMAAMEELPLPDDVKIAVILTLSELTMSMTSLELSLATEGGVRLTSDETERLGTVITEERFPHIARLFQAGGFVVEPQSPPVDDGTPTDDSASADTNVDDEFVFALELVFGGIRSLL